MAAEGYRELTDYGDPFRVLEENDVIVPGRGDRMVEVAGFWNVHAREYAQIDHERVYERLQDIEHFRAYAGGIARFVGIDGR